MQLCIATGRSMTDAMRAMRAIESKGIRCQIVNLDPTVTKNGCAYGVSFNCAEESKVRRTLETTGIPYGKIIGGK
jgi:transketolase C-terminal domain/subunit